MKCLRDVAMNPCRWLGLFFKMWLDILRWTLYSFDHSVLFWWTLFRLIGQFTPVLALYDPFGVDVPLNFDITHLLHVGGLWGQYGRGILTPVRGGHVGWLVNCLRKVRIMQCGANYSDNYLRKFSGILVLPNCCLYCEYWTGLLENTYRSN